MRTNRWFPVLIIAALPTLACNQTPDQTATEQQPPAAEPAPSVPEQPAPGAMAQAVVVDNAMPHPMVVYRLEAGERVELGTVEPDATETFSVPAAAGDTVELVAADMAETHQVEETVVAGSDTTTWTLGG